MTTKWTLLVLSLNGFVLAAAVAANGGPQPVVVNRLTGTLRVQQGVPCEDTVDLTTAVTGGRLELTPAEGVDVVGGKVFTLTLAHFTFAAFSVSRSCRGIGETRDYTEAGVRLARAITFTATSAGAGAYTVRIPKEQFLFRETSVVNGGPASGYTRPSEDVTGTINLVTGAMTMHVVIATRVHFQAGCTILGCVIDEDKDGLLTADVAGTMQFPDADADGVPDRTDNCRFVPNPSQTPVATPTISGPADLTIASCADHDIGFPEAHDRCDANRLTITHNQPGTFVVGPNIVTWQALDSRGRTASRTQTVTVADTLPPTVSCTLDHLTGNTFQTIATDDCASAPVVRLGTFVLTRGERIKINEVGRAGVRLVNTVNGVRHFQVGKGEAVITALDGSSNVATAVCK